MKLVVLSSFPVFLAEMASLKSCKINFWVPIQEPKWHNPVRPSIHLHPPPPPPRVSVLHKNVSQILAIIDFFKQRNYRKNLVSKEENYRYITLSQTSCLNLDRFGIGNYISFNSDCRSAPFAGLDLIFRVIYVSKRTHFKLIIDFRLECF